MLRSTRLLLQRIIFVRQITLVAGNNNTLFNGTNVIRILPTLTMDRVKRRNMYHRPSYRTNDERPGDWTCEECGFRNFSYRSYCFRCNSKPKHREVAAGDWICPNCEFYNFQSRKECFKCHTPSPNTDGNEENHRREF